MNFKPGTLVTVFGKYSGVVKAPSKIKVDADQVRVEYRTENGMQVACYVPAKEVSLR